MLPKILMAYFLIAVIISTIHLFFSIDSDSVIRTDFKFIFQEVIWSVIIGMLFGWIILPYELGRLTVRFNFDK